MHNFESGFVVRDQAWHGLATLLQDAPTVEEGIKQAALDWDVLTRPVLVPVPTGKGRGEKRIVAKGYHATVRASDQSVLGIVSSKYKPLQNAEAFEFFDKFLKDGTCQLEAAGSLSKGKYVWVLAKIANLNAEISKGDEVCTYLLLSNAHDGTRAVLVAFTPIRVVCWNTLSYAEMLADSGGKKQTSKAARVMHVGNVVGSLKNVQTEIDFAAQRIGDIVEQSQAFRKVQFGPSEYYKFLESVYMPEREAMRLELDKVRAFWLDKNHPKEALDEAFIRMSDLEEKIAKPFRRDSTITKLIQLFEVGPGADLAGKTLFGAVSAVTHYEEHLRAGNNENRLASSWFGGSTAKTRQQAYRVAADLVA